MKDKISGTALAVLLIAFVIVPVGCKKKTEPGKTFYDVVAEDDARLRAEPQPRETVIEEKQTSQQPTQQFRELTEEEQVEAERLLEWAIQSRKMGRLSMPADRLSRISRIPNTSSRPSESSRTSLSSTADDIILQKMKSTSAITNRQF